jgi:hypothetical protein
VVAHVVLFEPKPGVSDADRRTFLAALREAVSGIDEIRKTTVGRPIRFGVMQEINGGQKTYSYAAVLEFDDKAALGRYLEHPKHDNLRRVFWQLCHSTLIVDLEMSDVEEFMSENLV